MKAVNLLPREEASRRGSGRLDPLVLGGTVLLAAVVAGSAGGFLLEHRHAGSEQQQLSAAKAQLAAAQARIQHEQQSSHARPVLSVPSVTSQEKPWRDAVASALSNRIAFDRVLEEFERVVPSDVTLTDLTMAAPNPDATAAATTGTTSPSGDFTLSGTTFSEDSVARLLSRLMLVPDLNSVALSSSTADPQSGIVTFEIQAQMKGGPASAVPAASSSSSSSSTDTTATTTTSGGTS